MSHIVVSLHIIQYVNIKRHGISYTLVTQRAQPTHNVSNTINANGIKEDLIL